MKKRANFLINLCLIYSVIVVSGCSFNRNYINRPDDIQRGEAAGYCTIIGASKPGHLEDAVAALSVKLSAEEVNHLEELYQPHRIAGFEQLLRPRGANRRQTVG
jgi:hypothetical protein